MMGSSKDKRKSTANHGQTPRETQLKKDMFIAALHEAKAQYWGHVASARIAFKTDRTTTAYLGIHLPEITALGGWTRQAKEFYRKTLNKEEIPEKLAEYGIPKITLETCLARLKNLEGSKFWRKQTQEEWAKGEYVLQQTLEKAKKSFYEMADVSREAFKDTPENIVKLGLENSVEDVIERQKRDERRKWKKKAEEKNEGKSE